jgi:superfamily II DNA helicase RecQ
VWQGSRGEDCDDVVLIAKTSFGKSILFQLAPLIATRHVNRNGRQTVQLGIVLVLMPLNLLLDEQGCYTEGRLGARCVVLTRTNMSTELLKRIEEGEFTHGWWNLLHYQWLAG